MTFANRTAWNWLVAGYFAFGICLCASGLPAAEIEIRLVASDRESKPTVDTLVDFRRAAEGGLIGMQWVSGLTLEKAPLFPIANRGPLAPATPNVAVAGPGEKAPLKKSDAEDLLNDIKQEATAGKPPVARPVDVVDPLYVGQTFSHGREVGPQRQRSSTSTIELKPGSLIQPFGIAIDSRAKRIDIPCYPVTITATVAGQEYKRAAFTPHLTYAGQDLLADCLFEHSPDLPLGDTSAVAGTPSTLQAWLEGTRGGQRPFRRLTVYLPGLGKDQKLAYELNGQPFRVTSAGISLVETSPAGKAGNAVERAHLRLVDKFAMELVPAPSLQQKLHVPLLTALGPGWKYDGESLIAFEPGQSVLTLTLSSPAGRAVVLRPSLPVSVSEAGNWHLYAIVTAGRTPNEEPLATVVALPRSTATIKGKLPLLVSSANVVGTETLPKSITLVLRRSYPWSSTDEPDHKLELKQLKIGQYEAETQHLPAAGYLASLIMGESILPAVPLAVAQADTEGSVSLGTYHNRCDYYQGEEVQAAVVVRAIQDIQLDAAPLSLQHAGSGETLNVGSVSISAAKGDTRTVFIKLPTSKLRLGEHTLSIATEKLIAYPLRFTVYSSKPRTTFALYSWMVGSFSGPVRVGDDTITNLLFDQQPAQFLRPEELARFKDQDTPPALFKSAFATDPLLPAVEKTETYDEDTEFQMAVAMRLGLRYGPSYGWGMNSQEANWNPKHTLPEDLARMRRLCSLVTQRFRDFGNFAGLHLNWYPTYGGYWENHPATDGHRDRRAELLAMEVAEIELSATADDEPKQPELEPAAAAELDLAVKRHKYRVGALARAYQAETEQARKLIAGLSDRSLSEDVGQPGLSPMRPAYTSFLPISWFDQQTYYPSEYFSTLPAATVHAYTDYGFSPFQHLWGLDFWAAGVGDKPKWISTMSNGRDVMLPQALLAVARGADGVDINGNDPAAARVISQLLTAHGPYFQKLQPESDVAIITSLRQQIVHGKLVGRWMGYTGGTYFDLYTKLWYARRPPAVLLEEEVTPARLQAYKTVFLVNQQTELPPGAMDALESFVAAGGKVFKDKTTAAHFPGEVYDLSPGESMGPKWEGDKYVATRDQMFVGVQASYEATARSLDELLAKLPPPRVMSRSHQTLLGTLAGKKTAVVMAVNDTRTPPGIYHPWNFWSATVLAAAGELSFDKPYVVYDLLSGGAERTAVADGKGRFTLPVSFDRVAGRAFVLTPAPLKELRLTTRLTGHALQLNADVIDTRGESLGDPWPLEITLLDEIGSVQQQFYRAPAPQDALKLDLPVVAKVTRWRVRVKEMVSGLTSEIEIPLSPSTLTPVEASPVLIPRPRDVREFLAALRAANEAQEKQVPAPPLQILLDRTQILKQGEKLTGAAETIATRLTRQGIPTVVRTIDPLDIPSVPQRWQQTKTDRAYLLRAAAGEDPIAAAPLTTRYYQGERNRNEPDYLHPDSGYGEPAARYRLSSHVILLGLPEENCFLEDLHASVGMQPGADWLSQKSAVVQVIFDAFSPGYQALTIQASDVEGIIEASIDILNLATEGAEGESEVGARKNSVQPGKQAAGKQAVSPGSVRSPLPRWQDQFGASVSPISFTPDGGILASADMQANNYFKFAADGTLQHKWLGKYGITPSRSGETLWIHPWWGAPGYLNKIVCADAEAQPQWMMEAPHYSRGFQFWQHPGQAILSDRASDDLYVGGQCQVARITPAGKTLWLYDDTATANDVQSFRFRRDLMLHDVSTDGKLLLVSAFGIQPYSNFVSKFLRPALLLIDASTGKIIWEKADILIHHSACAFAGADGKQILIGDESPDRRRLVLLDLQGKERWSIPQPAGVSAAKLTADGERAVLRSAATRNNLFQITGEPQGLQVLTLADRALYDLPVTGEVTSWKLLPHSGDILVSTSDGRLTMFTLDGTAKWHKQFAGAASFLVSEDERQIVVGTPDGKLRWLNPQGETSREVDLLDYNRVKDLDQYVVEYTRTPGDAPQLSATPQAPASIVERGGEVVAFSKNLLSEDRSAKDERSLSPGEDLQWTATLQPGSTHVFTFSQRVNGPEAKPEGMLRVTITETANKKPLATAELALSTTWQERTIAFRATKDNDRVQVSVQYLSVDEKPLPQVELRAVGMYGMKFPSENLLAQRVPAVPGELPAAGSDDLLGSGKKIVPPTLRYHLPNDVDLTALARGAPPFQRTVEFTTPFDGKLADQPTSWLGKPLAGSTHATLEIKFDSPVSLGVLAVYEDMTSARHYTETYALFAREAGTRRMVQLGSVIENKSAFNLFVFPKLRIDAITYLWLKSADGHARIAELEGYLAEEDLLDP